MEIIHIYYIFIYSYIIDIDIDMPLKKGDVKSSSKKPLKKGGGLQTLIERLKSPKYPQYHPQDPDYVKPSPDKRSMLSNIHSPRNLPLEKPQSALALNRKNAKTYALAERMQGRSPPRSALSAIYRRLKPPENPPLEKPQRAKTDRGESLKRLIRILHRTKNKEP